MLSPLLLWLGLWLPSPSPAMLSELKVVDVCQALKNVHELKGTLIGIKAVMQGGSEGSWLEGECGGVFRSRNGFVWPDMVSLAFKSIIDSNRGRSHGHKVGRKLKAAGDAAHCVRNCDVRGVFVGVLETYPAIADRLFVHPSDGQVRTLGFGQNGMAPVQLVLKDVIDIKVTPGR